MARQRVHTREIDGLKFTVQVLPGTRGLIMSAYLVQKIGPAMLKALGNADSLLEVNLNSAADGLVMLGQQLSPQDFWTNFKEINDQTTISDPEFQNGATMPLLPIFDEVMSGRILTAYKVWAFAVQVNFNFLDILDRAAKVQAARSMQKPVESSAASSIS